MTGLEITLFILGTAFIIISFFIVDNSDRTPKSVATNALDADAFEQLRTDFVENSNREADIILRETEDKLESVSNDKIIAVGEYSDQILEKINSNHKEVVFLYQMLNEKEEELKTATTKMDNTRIECEKMLKEAKEYREEADRIKEESLAAVTAATTAVSTVAAKSLEPKIATEKAATDKVTTDKVTTVKTATEKAAAAKPATAKTVTNRATTDRTATAKTVTAKTTTDKAVMTATPASSQTKKTVKPVRQVRPVAPSAISIAPISADSDTASLNRNDEILTLYKSGKSVMEISKLLGMGQGEVKLIIDLYC